MPLNSPAPGRFKRRFSKNEKVVLFGITFGGIVLHFMQYLFERHDLHRRRKTAMAKRRLNQRHSKEPLIGLEVLKAEAFPFHGYELPVFS